MTILEDSPTKLSAPASEATALPMATTPEQSPSTPAEPSVSPLSEAPESAGPILEDPVLRLSADVLDDLEGARQANKNRLGHLTRVGPDADGGVRGLGMDLSHPDVARLSALVAGLEGLEADAIKQLQRVMRRHPLGPWVAARAGVGDKQTARLLAAIGDPYWNDLHNRPRLVSELWSFCGYGDASAQRLKRGVKVTWSPEARKRAYVISESVVKQLKAPCAKPEGSTFAVHAEGGLCRCGELRVVYDAAREKYDGSLHPTPCVRCGPSGHPAPAGSPRSSAHIHAMSQRKVIKVMLKGLWIEGRRLHGFEPEDESADG